MRRLILLAAVLALAFAPIPKPKPRPAEDDLKAMQGQWARSELTIDGNPRDERPGSVVPTIKGDVMAFGSPGDSWKLTLDASKKPRHLTAKNTKSNSAFYGVYKLEGDTLIICWRMGDKEGDRATDFDPKQPKVWYAVYKRKK